MPDWTFYRRDGSDPMAPGDWSCLRRDDPELSALIDRLISQSVLEKDSARPSEARSTPLTFYPGHSLLELLVPDSDAPLYYVLGQDQTFRLDGSRERILTLNRTIALKLDEGTVADYVRFYLSHTRHDFGRYVLIEMLDDVRWRYAPSEHDCDWFDSLIEPISVDQYTNTGFFDITTTVLHMDALMRCRLSISVNGDVVLVGHTTLAKGLPVVKDALGDEPRPRKIFNIESGWRPVPDDEAAALLELIGDCLVEPACNTAEPGRRDRIADDRLYFGLPDELVCKDVPFFPGTMLVRAGYRDKTRNIGFGVYALVGRENLYLLTSSSAEIHEALDAETLVLTAETLLDYLRFFCVFVHGREGPFRLVEIPSDLNLTRGPRAEIKSRSLNEVLPYDSLSLGDLKRTIRDPYLDTPADAESPWICRTCIQYGTDVYNAVLHVSANGEVYMDADLPFIVDLPVDEILNLLPYMKPDIPNPGVLERNKHDVG
ncbi:MAG: hypothetical protein KJP17_00990 [Gammaproteobacteria bacterium]|nr:hypothetical protein [Gammaproteobacteria bacterium]